MAAEKKTTKPQTAKNPGKKATPTDELFAGALVGASIGVASVALWGDFIFALAYIIIALGVHMALNQAARETSKRIRNAFVALSLVLAAALAGYSWHHLGVRALDIVRSEPYISGQVSQTVIARALTGGLVLLPIYRFLVGGFRHYLG